MVGSKGRRVFQSDPVTGISTPLYLRLTDCPVKGNPGLKGDGVDRRVSSSNRLRKIESSLDRKQRHGGNSPRETRDTVTGLSSHVIVSLGQLLYEGGRGTEGSL